MIDIPIEPSKGMLLELRPLRAEDFHDLTLEEAPETHVRRQTRRDERSAKFTVFRTNNAWPSRRPAPAGGRSKTTFRLHCNDTTLSAVRRRLSARDGQGGLGKLCLG